MVIPISVWDEITDGTQPSNLIMDGYYSDDNYKYNVTQVGCMTMLDTQIHWHIRNSDDISMVMMLGVKGTKSMIEIHKDSLMLELKHIAGSSKSSDWSFAADHLFTENLLLCLPGFN